MATTLRLKNLVIDNSCLGAEMILTGVYGYNSYVDDHYTGAIEGYKYCVTLPKLNFCHLDVKIPGTKMLEIKSGEHFPVVFDNLQVKIYEDKSKKLQLTAHATGVNRLDSKR